MEMIQNAYQGFAKQNYTMLDNLKLGYGGTKKEMARLIEDAAKLDDTVDAQSMSFANIVKAIHAVQVEMGIYGTTAKEASSTISGSLNMTKAAWSNLLTGVADDTADFDSLINNLVESVSAFGSNILPRIGVALDGAVKLIEGLFPKIIEALPNLISTLLPSLVNGALNIVQSFVTAISDNGDLLVQSAIDAVMTLADGILNMLPEIIKLGLDLIVSLALGIADALPELIPTIVDVILQIVDTLTNPDMLSKILDAALVLIVQLAYGLMEAIPKLVDATLTIIENLVDFLLDPANLGKLINAAIQIVVALAVGIVKAIPRLIGSAIKLVADFVKFFFDYDWGTLGKNIVDGLLGGLKKAWTSLKKWFTDAWDSLVGGVKNLLGIHSPSRVFAGIGKNMALGIGEGWDDEFSDVEKSINGSMSFDDATLGVSSYSGGGLLGGIAGGTSFGTVNINIDGANVQDDAALADMVAERLQRMTERRGAVFA
jgi:phage-related protein